MTTVLIVVASYFAVLIVLSLAARPYRTRFASLADEVLCDETASESTRYHVRMMVDTVYSLRTAPLQFFVCLGLIFTPSAIINRQAQESARKHGDLFCDPRFDELYELYMASAAAANPIFGALAYAATGIFVLKAKAYARRHHYAPPKPMRVLQAKTI